MQDDSYYMKLAYEQALKSYEEGGCPIGAVLVNNKDGDVLGAGYNRRVQSASPILHGEMSALTDAGRQKSYLKTTLYTTLSPCMMCSGTIVQFKIPRVVIGENDNFGGNENFLRARGVEIALLDDPLCKTLMSKFIAERPALWNEDISGE